ncbi:MAG: hypothetical protein AAF125_09285 [Chloroflexota bacterium]
MSHERTLTIDGSCFSIAPAADRSPTDLSPTLLGGRPAAPYFAQPTLFRFTPNKHFRGVIANATLLPTVPGCASIAVIPFFVPPQFSERIFDTALAALNELAQPLAGCLIFQTLIFANPPKHITISRESRRITRGLVNLAFVEHELLSDEQIRAAFSQP